MEYLDIVDENNELTGETASREEVHKKGLRHRHALGWIMNYNGEILLQKRATKKNFGRWERTGGHISAGETAEEAIFREVKEEIGIEVPQYQLKPMSMQRKETEKSKNFTYDFFFVVNENLENLKLQEEEVSDVKYFTIEQIEEIRQRKEPGYVFNEWNEEVFNSTIEELKQKRNDFLQFKKEIYNIEPTKTEPKEI